MSFAKFIGNQSTVNLLRRLKRAQRLPHALIFEGLAGVGRRTLARSLAKALLCQDTDSDDACGVCDSCLLLADGNHPDVNELPDESAVAELKVDVIREEVVYPCQESAMMGNVRCFIMPDIERMRGAAANALLKVLEEPPAGTYFLMTTQVAGGLLSTIRSRSQVYRLQPLQADELAQLLRRQGMNFEQAQQLAAVAGGSLRSVADIQLSDAPMVDLRQLLLQGFDMARVGRVFEALPQDPNKVTGGRTLGQEQRRTLAVWLDALIVELRQDLRRHGVSAEAGQFINRILQLKRDLQINIHPRQIIEGLSLPL